MNQRAKKSKENCFSAVLPDIIKRGTSTKEPSIHTNRLTAMKTTLKKSTIEINSGQYRQTCTVLCNIFKLILLLDTRHPIRTQKSREAHHTVTNIWIKCRLKRMQTNSSSTNL